ncbi:F-box only protein 46 [Monodelphis domestica]|uniref:F-box only protein 46 n=1 Tax=Monodelphis domestica TaxID=13616 RepID=UPI0024E233E4|nr:F-box only protein 46 [Monodelphis domestica]
MDPSSLSPVQLWCPRPFGTYSQNQPRSAAPSARKPPPPPACPEPSGGSSISSGDGLARSENTPPAPATPAAPLLSTAPGEEGRVLLDTWYVIKPGNTKEKVAFFVAHQCGGGASRASAGKVKGHWGSDSSKAKRRRRCLDSTKPRPGPGKPPDGGGDEDQQLPAPSEASACAPEDVDLLSVAEMVALVEQRAALALQSYPRAGAPTPVVFVSAEQGAQGAVGEHRQGQGSDCSRVAEAVAHFEAQRDGPRKEEVRAGEGGPGGGPGEVRIAFRISSGREPRSPEGGPPGAGSGGRPGCPYGSGPGPSSRAQDKITCDLYQLISPSRDALPSNVDFLLARADEAGEGEAAGTSRPEGPPERASAGATAGDKPPAPPPPPTGARECGGGGAAGFHVDVVVTGVVDECVFFGKDGAKTVKEETVCLTVSPEEPPPPGQLFLLPARGEPAPEAPAAPEVPTAPAPEGSEPEAGGGAGAAAPDASLCRLYHHVSHDFLEIRFKIQRLLEPRQYMLLLPEHVLVKIFGFLPTRALAALKCTCHYFKCVIETFGVQATDSRWSRHPLYRDDPCKQCRKCYEKGDVSLCRWHPKPYHHDLPYGRSYWMCCRRPDKDTPGCRLGLHDNNWVLPCHALRPAREDAR